MFPSLDPGTQLIIGVGILLSFAAGAALTRFFARKHLADNEETLGGLRRKIGRREQEIDQLRRKLQSSGAGERETKLTEQLEVLRAQLQERELTFRDAEQEYLNRLTLAEREIHRLREQHGHNVTDEDLYIDPTQVGNLQEEGQYGFDPFAAATEHAAPDAPAPPADPDDFAQFHYTDTPAEAPQQGAYEYEYEAAPPEQTLDLDDLTSPIDGLSDFGTHDGFGTPTTPDTYALTDDAPQAMPDAQAFTEQAHAFADKAEHFADEAHALTEAAEDVFEQTNTDVAAAPPDDLDFDDWAPDTPAFGAGTPQDTPAPFQPFDELAFDVPFEDTSDGVDATDAPVFEQPEATAPEGDARSVFASDEDTSWDETPFSSWDDDAAEEEVWNPWADDLIDNDVPVAEAVDPVRATRTRAEDKPSVGRDERPSRKRPAFAPIGALLDVLGPSSGDGATASAEPAFAAPTDDLPSNEGDFDELTLIAGITPSIMDQLNAVGVTTFDDIARWSRSDVRRMAETLGLGNDIQQQNWILQAQNFLFDRHNA